jgi:hypothetical protein
MTITKADLAQKVADDCGFMKGEAQEIVEKLLGIIEERLAYVLSAFLWPNLPFGARLRGILGKTC